MANMDQKLQAVYNYLESFINENGYCPSVREICAELNIKSTATCHLYLEKLSNKGMIIKSATKKRAMGLAKQNDEQKDYLNIPVLGTVTCGTPILAEENFDGYVPISKDFGQEDELFILNAKGSSMINAGIYNGDQVIVRKQDNAKNGDIIVAYFDDGVTIKRFYKYSDHIVLHPENETMSDIILKDVSVVGIVKGLIRKF